MLEALLAMPVRTVFAEKPLTADIASARRLVAAYAAARRPLAVNYFRRWDPAMADLKRAIAEGAWGRLQSATVRYVKGISNSGSHAIDLLHFLIGPLRAEAVFRRRFDHERDDPTLDALLAAAAAPVYLIGGDGRHYFTFEIDLMFERGRVAVEDQGFALRVRRPYESRAYQGYRYLERGAWSETGAGQALVHAVEDIRRGLADGAALLSDGESALAAQETCDTLLALAARLPPEKTLGDSR
jgi:predicted dehydrogenase